MNLAQLFFAGVGLVVFLLALSGQYQAAGRVLFLAVLAIPLGGLLALMLLLRIEHNPNRLPPRKSTISQKEVDRLAEEDDRELINYALWSDTDDDHPHRHRSLN